MNPIKCKTSSENQKNCFIPSFGSLVWTHLQNHGGLLLLISAFFILNLFTLTDFPFVHSDEAWLSGLTRHASKEGTLFLKEPFFDLYPRAIHSFRLVFMGIQGLFMGLFGYRLFTFRLISLIFVSAGLRFFYKILLFHTKSKFFSLLGSLLLALNIQILYGAHFARQEAILLFLFLLLFWQTTTRHSTKNTVFSALCIGFSIAVHPNSFILFLSVLALYLIQIRHKKKGPFQAALLIALVSASFLCWLSIGLFKNPTMLSDYLAFGQSLGIDQNLGSRFSGFFWYHYRLFHQIGGTYLLYDIRLYYILTPFAILSTFFLSFFAKKNQSLKILAQSSLIFLLAQQVGIFLIGRFNQTAIIFAMPFILMPLLALLKNSSHPFQKPLCYGGLFVLLIIISFNLYQNLKPQKEALTQGPHYEAIGEILKEVLPPNKKVLANLNLDYHFKDGALLDYRNLYFLKANDLSLTEYLKKNHIEYIIWYEEMDYIKRNEPKWDILYGPLNYYDEMVDFLETKAILIHTFENPQYAMRIAKYQNTYPWLTKIYRICP